MAQKNGQFVWERGILRKQKQTLPNIKYTCPLFSLSSQRVMFATKAISNSKGRWGSSRPLSASISLSSSPTRHMLGSYPNLNYITKVLASILGLCHPPSLSTLVGFSRLFNTRPRYLSFHGLC